MAPDVAAGGGTAALAASTATAAVAAAAVVGGAVFVVDFALVATMIASVLVEHHTMMPRAADTGSH